MPTRLAVACLAASAFALLGSGCASIIKGGGPQAISIRSAPAEADVKVIDMKTGNTITTGKTPFIATLNKSRGYFSGASYRVVIEKAGFESREVLIDSRASGWYIGGNLLFGGLIGWLIVDPATGAMWYLDPDDLSVELKGATAPAAAPAQKPVALLTTDELAARHPELLSRMRPLEPSARQ